MFQAWSRIAEIVVAEAVQCGQHEEHHTKMDWREKTQAEHKVCV
ncbi:hypothetical protein V461_19750 [Pantoea ananatis BRT98]|nr:hypothetical protein V461_19750 [Pantoea ananatis BRT98]